MLFKDFSNIRLEKIKDLVKQYDTNVPLDNFTKSELLLIIDEACLPNLQKEYAILKFIDKLKDTDICYKLFISHNTSTKWNKIIKNKLQLTCTRLFC